MTETEDLHRSLERLRSEISKLGDRDETTRARMNSLVSDLESQLASDGDDEHPAALIDAVRQHIEQFELEHPRMTGALNRILVGLSNLGI